MITIKIKCDWCGESYDKKATEVRRSKKLYRPMFCSRSCSAHYRNSKMTKKYWKELYEKNKSKIDIKEYSNNLRDEYSSFRYFIRQCRQKQKDKNINYNIDLSYLKELWNKQNGICPYTKIKMILPNTTSEFEKCHSLKRASLDRIDSYEGYIKGNIEFVCLAINLAKNNFTKINMIDFIKEIGGVGQDSNPPSLIQ